MLEEGRRKGGEGRREGEKRTVNQLVLDGRHGADVEDDKSSLWSQGVLGSSSSSELLTL